MERSAWTDERISDRFDHIDREFADLRSEMRDGFAGLRSEMRDGFTGLRSEMENLRSFTLRLQLGTLIPVLGLIAALIARG